MKTKKILSKLNYWGDKISPYVLLSPFIFTLTVFFGYAFIRSVYFSFTNYDMFNEPAFVGFKNYAALFSETKFFYAVKNSLYFAFIVTFCQTAGALLLAVVMNQKVKGMKFFRAAYYMPSVTSSIVITLIFMWLFQQKGIINYLLTKIEANGVFILLFIITVVLFLLAAGFTAKIKHRKTSFLTIEKLTIGIALALFAVYISGKTGIIVPTEIPLKDTVWLNTREMIPGFLGEWGIPRPLFSIMMLNIWTTIPTMSLIYLAGLQDISPALYEAAEIDGASKFDKFRYITVPQLGKITFLIVTMGLIGTLQMFDQVAIIGGAAPLESTITLAYYVYNNAFPSSGIVDIGKASAASNVLAVITLTIVMIQKKIAKE